MMASAKNHQQTYTTHTCIGNHYLATCNTKTQSVEDTREHRIINFNNGTTAVTKLLECTYAEKTNSQGSIVNFHHSKLSKPRHCITHDHSMSDM